MAKLDVNRGHIRLEYSVRNGELECYPNILPRASFAHRGRQDARSAAREELHKLQALDDLGEDRM